MNSKPVKYIERIKTILLVVLFLSTILLLYFFWRDTGFKLPIEMGKSPAEALAPAPEEVTRPFEIAVNFSSGNYTLKGKNQGSYWEKAIAEFREFSKSENIIVEKLKEEEAYKYDEAMGSEQYQSIEFRFLYDIPITDFCERYDIKKPSAYDQIEGISSIGYSTGSKESLLVHSQNSNAYYRIYTDEDHDGFEKIIDSIRQENFTVCFPVQLYLKGKTDPQEVTPLMPLMPLVYQTTMEEFAYQQEIYVDETDKIRKLAETFFGENFDFTRGITESKGTEIFMYGYGEKVLVINVDGTVEYREEPNESNYTEQKYFDALDTALHYVAEHGSWDSLNGSHLKPYVRDVDITEKDKRKKYRFVFGMEAGDDRVYGINGQSIVIEVFGKQITYYKRNMIDFEKQEMTDILENRNLRTAFDASNAIARNVDYIRQVLASQLPEFAEMNIKVGDGLASDTSYINVLADKIDYVQTGYIKLPADFQGESKAVPAWIVSIDGLDLYFNLYDDPRPLGFTNNGSLKGKI